MSKKILPRVVAVIVVSLRKFVIYAKAAKVWIEELEPRPRTMGEPFLAYSQAIVNPEERRRAALVIVNGKVLKHRDGQPDQVADDPIPPELRPVNPGTETEHDRMPASLFRAALAEALQINALDAAKLTNTELLTVVLNLRKAKETRELAITSLSEQLEARKELGRTAFYAGMKWSPDQGNAEDVLAAVLADARKLEKKAAEYFKVDVVPAQKPIEQRVAEHFGAAATETPRRIMERGHRPPFASSPKFSARLLYLEGENLSEQQLGEALNTIGAAMLGAGGEGEKK